MATLVKAWAALACAVTLACVLGAFAPKAAWAATADTSWYDGHEGDTTFVVSDANDIAGLAQLVNSGKADFKGKTVTFASSLPGTGATLVLSGEFQPIGTASHPFNGIFDGKGLAVRGLSITKGTDGVGFFGYAGAASSIRNLSVTGSITLNVGTDGSVIRNVGGVVGVTQGSISGCASSVQVSVVSAVAATESNPRTVKYVGGVAGRVYGDVQNCSTRSYADVYVESSAGALSATENWIAGYVGGVVGMQGPEPFGSNASVLGTMTNIVSCDNAAKVRIHTYTAGLPDRFGNPTNTASQFLGGIVGYTTGNVTNCTNSGNVDSSHVGSDGKVQAAIGATSAGGIAGAMRVEEQIVAAGDNSDPGLSYNKATGQTAVITMSGCSNTGNVFGLSQAGGVVGQAGSYTVITACSNTGNVEGSRYTKPSPGGVAGRTYGDMSYCYNTGTVTSTTGAGYYAAGIVGMVGSIGTDANGDEILPEIWACYNTGYITTSTGAFRSGSIVGAFDAGYIHDCFSLTNRALTNRVNGDEKFNGTMADSVVEIPEASISTAETVARLNACADKDGWNVYFSLPEGKSYGDRSVHPVLVSGSYASAKDLSTVSGAKASTTDNAPYSTSSDPVPQVSASYQSGSGTVTLVQDADFRVIPQADTAGTGVSSTGFTATIVGIGNYTGKLPANATYQIKKGPISECTIVAESVYYNFGKQKPQAVHLYDAAGNEISSSEYSWSVDESLYASTAAVKGLIPYQDAQSVDQASYPITVTAAASGNYEGSKTSECFTIKLVPFAYSNASDNPNQGSLKIGDIVWGDQTWKFEDVCGYAANNGAGDQSKRGALKVKYTGEPIKLKVTGITYLGRNLVEVEEGNTDWMYHPKNYGYKLLYGNANPELGSDSQMQSDESLVTNVTGEDYAAFTIRASAYSNFDNFVTVWFEITPASLTDDCEMTGFEDTVAYKGASAAQDNVKFTYNGMTLEKGRDYTATYKPNLAENTMTVTFTGVGNYTGSITKTYATTGTPISFSDVDPNAWYETEDDYIGFVSMNGFMTGKGGTDAFGIGDNLTRGEVATILYRMATGNTAASTDNNVNAGFNDVYPGDFYAAAAKWAYENGVIKGDYDAAGNPTGYFRPLDNVTRQELTAMIYRFADYYGLDMAVDTEAVLATASDAGDVDTWARESMAWCVSKDIVDGNVQPDGMRYLNPKGYTLREQMAKIVTKTWRDVIVPQASPEMLTR